MHFSQKQSHSLFFECSTYMYSILTFSRSILVLVGIALHIRIRHTVYVYRTYSYSASTFAHTVSLFLHCNRRSVHNFDLGLNWEGLIWKFYCIFIKSVGKVLEYLSTRVLYSSTFYEYS